MWYSFRLIAVIFSKMWFILVWLLVKSRRTDRKLCIRAHRAVAQVGSKNVSRLCCIFRNCMTSVVFFTFFFFQKTFLPHDALSQSHGRNANAWINVHDHCWCSRALLVTYVRYPWEIILKKAQNKRMNVKRHSWVPGCVFIYYRQCNISFFFF